MKYILSLLLIVIVKIVYEVNFPILKYVNIDMIKINRGKNLKILQISDYHNYDKNMWIVKKIKEEKPDIIVLTGDIIDMNTKNYQNSLNLVKKIIRINEEVYFVRGNHEWKNKKGNAFISDLAKTKIKILQNRGVNKEVNGVKLTISGVDDYHTRHSDFELAQKNIREDRFSLLLSHSPDMILEKIKIRADLTLSGHTHGGQIRVPIIGALISPGQGIFPKYTKGIYELIDNNKLYIDSGLGTSRLPIRFLNRSQMTIININGIKKTI